MRAALRDTNPVAPPGAEIEERARHGSGSSDLSQDDPRKLHQRRTRAHRR